MRGRRMRSSHCCSYSHVQFDRGRRGHSEMAARRLSHPQLYTSAPPLRNGGLPSAFVSEGLLFASGSRLVAARAPVAGVSGCGLSSGSASLCSFPSLMALIPFGFCTHRAEPDVQLNWGMLVAARAPVTGVPGDAFAQVVECVCAGYVLIIATSRVHSCRVAAFAHSLWGCRRRFRSWQWRRKRRLLSAHCC